MASEPDWDRHFDLPAWQALPASERVAWIEQAWRRESDQLDLDYQWWNVRTTRRQRYERGQTAWDIGLEPQPFDIQLAEAVGAVKPELIRGLLFGSEDVRDRVLSALLANAGLRRTVRLAPLDLWRQALDPEGRRVPVVRPEFVADPEHLDVPTYWLRHQLAEAFYRSARAGGQAEPRATEIGYLRIGERSLPRPDLMVLREGLHRRTWPTPAGALLVVEIAATHSDVLFDWQVRRPAYLEAGAGEVWVIDAQQQRILRQVRGQEPTEVVYRPGDQDQAILFAPHPTSDAGGAEASTPVPVGLADLFGTEEHRSRHADGPIIEDFAAWQEHEQARLRRYETPWTIGHTPQWFWTTMVELSGRFKDELWQGCLFGAEYRRDEILSALLANVGLCGVIPLAPRELWQRALETLEPVP